MGLGAESRDWVGWRESRDWVGRVQRAETGCLGRAQLPPCHCPQDSAIKAMVTEMSIGEEDFQQLQAQEGVAITFCPQGIR